MIGKTLFLALLLAVLPAVHGVADSKGDIESAPEGYGDTLSEILKDEKLKGLFKNPDILKTIEKRLEGGSTRQHGEIYKEGSRGSSSRGRVGAEDGSRGDGILSRRRGGIVDKNDMVGLSETCPEARSKAGNIIKTKDSIKLGAVFLESPSDLRDPDDCVQRCCSLKNCTTAVIKTVAGERLACYLFDCGKPNLCLFSPNNDFTVVQFPTRGALQKQEHEQELVGLATIEAASARTTKIFPTTAPATADSTGAGKLSGRCDADSDCIVTNSGCVSGHCACAEGFHPFNNRCKPDCREYEFECKNIDQACIAIYDRCDGTEQCLDKTDEQDCPALNSGKDSSSKSSSEDENKKKNKYDDDLDNSISHEDKVKGVSKDNNSDVIVATGNKDIGADKLSANQGSTTVAPPILDKRVNADSQSHESKTEHVPVELKHWPMPANRGAVIALVLGMLVTTMLIILVGCRLRTVRRRSRKGRPMGGNDADYLINGMYL